MRGRAEVAGLLTRRGARADARNAYGMTALHLAADNKVVAVLVTAGADVNALDERGRTPLHTARQGSVAKALIDHRADLRIRTPEGRTAMEMSRRGYHGACWTLGSRPHAGAAARAHWSGQGHALEYLDASHGRLRPFRTQPGVQRRRDTQAVAQPTAEPTG